MKRLSNEEYLEELNRRRPPDKNVTVDRALLERVADAYEALLRADEKGTLHDADCIGLHGYDCKAWCKDAREVLAELRKVVGK